jgi:hypothetical protein
MTICMTIAPATELHGRTSMDAIRPVTSANALYPITSHLLDTEAVSCAVQDARVVILGLPQRTTSLQRSFGTS